MLIVGYDDFYLEADKILKDRDDKVQALASAVREKVIVPLCRKHGMRFFSGNGVFFFFKRKSDGAMFDDKLLFRDDGHWIAPEMTEEEIDDLGKALDLLNKELSHGPHEDDARRALRPAGADRRNRAPRARLGYLARALPRWRSRRHGPLGG